MLRFLPPYSPGLNPIAMAFADSPPAFPASAVCWNLKPASLKALLRALAIGTVDALWKEIGHSCDFFGPAECQNDFAAA